MQTPVRCRSVAIVAVLLFAVIGLLMPAATSSHAEAQVVLPCDQGDPECQWYTSWDCSFCAPWVKCSGLRVDHCVCTDGYHQDVWTWAACGHCPCFGGH